MSEKYNKLKQILENHCKRCGLNETATKSVLIMAEELVDLKLNEIQDLIGKPTKDKPHEFYRFTWQRGVEGYTCYCPAPEQHLYKTQEEATKAMNTELEAENTE